VRHLANSAGAFVSGQSFNYDAYGNLLGSVTPQTSLFYTGEWHDSTAQQYYLRARYYNPANGRLNRMDPFAGNNRDPQSLHKYLYAHCNPVMNVDPSGMYSFGELVMVSLITACVFALVAGEVVRIKGGTQEQIEDAQWKWFWIGFFAGAIVYSGFWAYAVLTAPAALSGPTIQQLINDTPRIQHSFSRHWQDILNHFNELRPIAQQVLSKPQAVKEGAKLGSDTVTIYAAQVEVNGVMQWVSVAIYQTGHLVNRIATILIPTAEQLERAGIKPGSG